MFQQFSYPALRSSHALKYSLLAATCIALSSCQTEEDVYSDRTVTDLYTTAKAQLADRSFTKAAKSFAEVERQHPYSNWALRAQIMSAYSYYQAKKYDDAIDGFQTFIQLHPGHPDVAYAFYMVGLCYYEQIPIVERDQEPAEKSMNAFNEVMNRFPTSLYAKDARFKIDLLKDHMAAKEMDIGRFYQKKGSYLAALNRFKGVAEQYATTGQIEEALFRMVECYSSLGLKDEAAATAAVLHHNYPHSQWYRDAYALLEKPLPLIVPDKKRANEILKKGDSADPIEGDTLKEMNLLSEAEEDNSAHRADPLISEELVRIAAEHDKPMIDLLEPTVEIGNSEPPISD